jgi:hypothetical protein
LVIAEVTGDFAGAATGFVTFTPVGGGPTSGAPLGRSGAFRMLLACGTYRVVIVTDSNRREIGAVTIDSTHYRLT